MWKSLCSSGPEDCGAILQLRGKLGWPKLFKALARGGSAESPPSPGQVYDLTRRGDPALCRRLQAHLALETPTRVLDLACGTGNYAALLTDAGFQVTGSDRSEAMLAAAAAKSPGCVYCRCEAAAQPFAPASFDGAVCVSALHLFEDLPGVLGEAHRVLAAGRRLVVFTALRQQMRGYWLNHYFPDTLEQAIARTPDQNRIEALFAASGFALEAVEPWEVPERPVDLFLYAGKHLPGIYLDRRVRGGISAFAQLAAPREIIQGVRKLTSDIASGEINRVKNEFEHDLGDYSFLAATKVAAPHGRVE